MRPTETLSREHALVILVTKEAEQEVRYMRDTGEYRKEEVGELVDFFEFFTEACHDPKEERLLFARLCKRGLSRETGILAQFYREHEEFTTRLRDIEQWLRKDKKEGPLDVGELADQLEAYLNLMRSHVAREDEHLFALADGMLTDEDQEELERAFEAVESEEVAEGIHEKYSELARLLAGRPTETLLKEHKICRLVLDAAAREIEATRKSGHVNVENVDGLVDFFHFFTTECHEPKEGQLLFNKLAQRGVSTEEGLLAELIREHRDLIDRLGSMEGHAGKASKGGRKAVTVFCDESDAYIALMRAHMAREEELLFPMVCHVLTQRDHEELARAFESVEWEEISEGVHDKYFDLAHRLAIT
jgi:hemerythrin-like domain-containing protein